MIGHAAHVGHAFGLEEAVHHGLAALRGQVDRQAFGAEGLAQLLQQRARVGAVYLVDDEQAAQAAPLGVVHQALRAVLHAVVAVHHHRAGFHRGQGCQRGAAEFRQAGRVDQIDVALAVVDGGDGGADGMAARLLHRVEIGNRGAALDGPGRLDDAARVQQGLEQRGLAGARVAHERDVSDAVGGVGHERTSRADARCEAVMVVRGRRAARRGAGRSGGRSWRSCPCIRSSPDW